MAEVAGDRRLVGAHDRAVIAALGYIERHGAATRARTGGEVKTVATAKLAVATFRHNTSRAKDPQLHTHSVILNMTQDKNGAWRSVESLAFFKLYTDAGAIYRQALALETRQLGYVVTGGKGSMFEIAGVPDSAIKAFSARGNQVEAALAERGKTRADATAAEKAMITLETRDKKSEADRATLVPEWREQAAAEGFGKAERRQLIAESKLNAGIGAPALASQGQAEAAATLAVATAARSLSEREAVFGAAALEARAGEFAIGRASGAQIVAAVARAERTGELVPREHRGGRGAGTRGFATREGVMTERRMLMTEAAGRGGVTTPSTPIEASRIVVSAAMRSEAKGHVWTRGQREATIAGDGRRALEVLDRGGGRVVEASEASERYKAMASDYAALSKAERARTLVMDTTRQGRETLNDAIRAELRGDGTIGKTGIEAMTLEGKGLTREEARHARSYEAGDIVAFRRDYAGPGIEKGQAYRVANVDAAANRIELSDTDGRKVDWRLDKWGRGQVDTFTETRREFATGDKVQFTRNDRQAGRVNGGGGTVTAIDSRARTMTVREAKGQEHLLQLDTAADRHIRHGWVSTVHGSQGATAQRSMVHLDGFRSNTVDARSAYVAISRARQGATVYTDSLEKLVGAIEGRSGERAVALAPVRAAPNIERQVERSASAKSGHGIGLGA